MSTAYALPKYASSSGKDYLNHLAQLMVAIHALVSNVVHVCHLPAWAPMIPCRVCLSTCKAIYV